MAEKVPIHDEKFQQIINRKELSHSAKGHLKVKTISNCERLNALPLSLGIRQDVCSHRIYLFNIILEVLASVIRQDKEIERHTNWKRRNKFSFSLKDDHLCKKF